jgi:replication factor C subunit 3/5
VGKIIPAIQSRCTRFRFAPLESPQILGSLQRVFDMEQVDITNDGKDALLKLTKGDMRKALNILQVQLTNSKAAHATKMLINEDLIYATTGAPKPADIKTIIGWLFNSDFSTAYSSTFNFIKISNHFR